MTVGFGGPEVNAPSNYSYKHRTHRTNLIELCYLVWIIAQIGKHYQLHVHWLHCLPPPPLIHETDDLKNAKHSCTEHLMCWTGLMYKSRHERNRDKECTLYELLLLMFTWNNFYQKEDPENCLLSSTSQTPNAWLKSWKLQKMSVVKKWPTCT